LKLLVVIDEFTRECLAIDVNRKIKGPDVVELLRYLFAVRGEPDFFEVTTVLNLRRMQLRNGLKLRVLGRYL
jgi:hypothetical protein